MLLTLLCWFAIIFFFAATVRKFMDYAKKPMHGRQDLYPIPGEEAEKAEHGGSYFEDQKWFEKPRKKNHVGEIVVRPLLLAIISSTLLLASVLVTLCHAILIV